MGKGDECLTKGTCSTLPGLAALNQSRIGFFSSGHHPQPVDILRALPWPALNGFAEALCKHFQFPEETASIANPICQRHCHDWIEVYLMNLQLMQRWHDAQIKQKHVKGMAGLFCKRSFLFQLSATLWKLFGGAGAHPGQCHATDMVDRDRGFCCYGG